MNIFTYIDNYIKANSNTTYGDILANNKDNNIANMLSNDESQIYESIKESDRQRLLRFQ